MISNQKLAFLWIMGFCAKLSPAIVTGARLSPPISDGDTMTTFMERACGLVLTFSAAAMTLTWGGWLGV